MTTDLHNAGLVALTPVRVGQHAQWAALTFDRLRRELMKDLSGLLLDVQHIGGTAVPDLLSRRIVDVLVITTNLERFDQSRSLLERQGYTGGADGGLSGQRLFKLGSGTDQHAQLYVYQAGDPVALKHLLLRDYLRAHRAEALSYSRLKATLAERHLTHPRAYAAGKRPRVQRLLAAATGRG